IVLEHMRKRPGMYIGTLTVSNVDTFLRGFVLGRELIDPDLKHDKIYRETIANRGWKSDSPQTVWRQMQERGFTDQAIIDELLTIEFEVWKQIASQTDDNKPYETDT